MKTALTRLFKKENPKPETGEKGDTKRDWTRSIAVVGPPNVGKSVLFNALSKQYATVSNYPGTTVEVTRATLTVGKELCRLTDTPGMYSLSPISEEERVARTILMEEKPDLVLHVIDASNIERMLPMTLQLIEAGLYPILVLNIMDDAEKNGVSIDIPLLSDELGIPVVGTVATTGRGVPELLDLLGQFKKPESEETPKPVHYSRRTERSLDALGDILTADDVAPGLSRRAAFLLLLREDHELLKIIGERSPSLSSRITRTSDALKADLPEPVEYHVAAMLLRKAQQVSGKAVKEKDVRPGFREALSRLMMHPVTGFPIAFLALYLGLYKFVGQFGAGTVVDYIEGSIFEAHINPWFDAFVTGIIPWEWLSSLFVGDYGVITLGLRYAIALILPLVTLFFLVFAVIEDSGYLPRLAMLVDRAFKKLGLSGRAVIPMVLGLGCDTMATMVTRTLPTKRERVIATLLLALAVPCSAQLGVIMAVLGSRPGAVAIWAGTIGGVFMLIGYLTARLLPGSTASFYMELPPLRAPKLSNVLTKTYVRVKWYAREILPLFLLASVLIWLGQLTGLFDLLVRLLHRPVELIGLPTEAAEVFLFGFFRRDYGAAGLYDLNKAGLLDGRQLVVGCIALTLFLPCVAQFLINVKERGWQTGVTISIFVLLFSFAAAFVVNKILTTLGVML